VIELKSHSPSSSKTCRKGGEFPRRPLLGDSVNRGNPHPSFLGQVTHKAACKHSFVLAFVTANSRFYPENRPPSVYTDPYLPDRVVITVTYMMLPDVQGEIQR
jgi:hypothetical protein